MVPRLLAMLSVVSVFLPSFFMVGITRELFIPLSLAVGFAMIASTTLASTLVPIMAVWLLKDEHKHAGKPDFIDHLKDALGHFVRFLLPMRAIIIPVYLAVTGLAVFSLYEISAKSSSPRISRQ
ncbi:MAG: efflux RND transporter permease subunit [Candidatus Competibacteraceae bacterium]|nr:efflux RND transporter permease subunit [Candidatus Competibacteraceae bacterium]